MIRMLFTAGAVALAVVLGSDPVLAGPNSGHTAPPASAPTTYPGYNPPWHYEWQYSYDRHGQWNPGWVVVPNNTK